MRDNKNKISVIIPTKDSWVTLEPCIKSLLTQSFPVFEIIIIDNASKIGLTEKINNLNIHQNIRLKIFRNEINLGVTGGRNRGIKEADANSNYLLFFDHDMIADKDMVKKLISVFEDKNSVGIATPKIYYWEKRNEVWAAGTGINLWTGKIIFRGGKDVGQFNRNEEVQVAPASFMVTRDLIQKIGGFDDIYFATYEDTDFCFRAKNAGFKTYYVSDAHAYHKIPYDADKSTVRLLDRTYWIGRNRVIFMKRFGKSFLVFIATIPLYFGYYIYQSLKYKKYKAIIEFINGTFSGLVS